MRRVTLLLTLDAFVNLALGTMLLFFPKGLVVALGLPYSASAFYPSILGAVLFGIGIALLLERNRPGRDGVGLGLAGAVAINLCGGLVLAGWLLIGNLDLPMRGTLLLWILVLLLVGLSTFEFLTARGNIGDG